MNSNPFTPLDSEWKLLKAQSELSETATFEFKKETFVTQPNLEEERAEI